MNTRKFFWLLSRPTQAFKRLSDRTRYPSYKTYVGPPHLYDELGRYQFELLRSLGLEPCHSLLDVGCGSLRAGRFLIRYLGPGNYFGMEPNRRMLRTGIRHNLDKTTLNEKRPTFRYDGEFNLSAFGKKFDFVLAHSIFTHAAQSQIRKCLLEARRVMSGKSLFLVNYNNGESDYAGEEWVYPAHVTYTFGCIATLFRHAGLACLPLDVEHPTASSWVLACDPSAAERLAAVLDKRKPVSAAQPNPA